MGRERVRGWVRRRGQRLLLQLPPVLRQPLARRGWSLAERRFEKEARDHDADWAASLTEPPLPPARLRSLVASPSDAERFLAIGEENARFVASVLSRAGVAMSGRALDFGCGCGRIARWWPQLGHELELHGCDPNPELAAWCGENLPGFTATRSEEEPPAPYPDDHFDIVYAFSIFTHLPTESQDAWLDELHRILRPGGALLFTTNGGLAASSLPYRELAAFARGEPITLFAESAGSNLCAAYRPSRYVGEHMLRRFEPVLSLPAETGRSPLQQDTYVARKRTAARRLAVVASDSERPL